MKKISICFSKFTDVNLLKKAEFICSSLDGNPLFVTLAILLPQVADALDLYTTALSAAATNDRNWVAKKNQCRAELETLLKQLGMAVMAEAKGNEVMLVSSGFTVSKTREPRYITNPGNVTLSNGISSGQMGASVKAVWGAKSYVYQISDTLPTGDSQWASTTASGCKFVFENLVPGTQYWVRVAVIGSRKQIAYSNVATWFAQ